MQVSNKATIAGLFSKSSDEIAVLTQTYIEQAHKDVDQVITIKDEERTFANTCKAFDRLCSLSNISLFSAAIHALEMLSPDKTVRDAAHEAIIKIQSFFVEHVSNNLQLYQAIKAYEQGNFTTEVITEEERYFVIETIKDFKRSGLDLPNERLEKVKLLNKELGQLRLQFESNIAQDQRYIFAEKCDLEGLSQEFINSLEVQNGKYKLGTDYPTYFAVMDSCQTEKIRKNLHRAFNNRAYPQNETILKQIIAKRDELARTIGFKSYCHLDIESEMAGTPETAEKFLCKLSEKATKKEQKEFNQLICHLPDSVTLTENKKIKPWDVRYIKNHYKKKHFNIDEQKISEYFPTKATTTRLLQIYETFFNLSFERSDIALWHKDLELITVNTHFGELLGYLILDLYPRANKYSHACQMTIKPAIEKEGPAVAVVVANFPKPTSEKPALLQRDDVETFFHEFGHALHAILGRTTIGSFSGTNVKTDFVEMPSQMLEEWLSEKEILQMVSSHYETGEKLPEETIEKILSLKHFDSGDFLQRQCYLSYLALEYFKAGAEKNPKEVFANLCKKMRKNIEFDPEDNMYASFGHLSGYGARYYSYMWSKVFALDLFSHIKTHGILNPEIGKKYAEEILCKGGSQDPNKLLSNFLGRNPNEKAFFENMGIL